MNFSSIVMLVLLIGLGLTPTANACAQGHTEHNTDTCFHVELSLAHYCLELAYVIEQNDLPPGGMVAGKLSAQQLFTEFFRLLTLVEAKYPEHYLEEDFYEKAIWVANRQKNLGASAYLSQQKKKSLLAQYGADYLTRQCHCGKCSRHED